MDARVPLPGLLCADAVLARIGERLAARYAGVFSPETVRRQVAESHRLLARTAAVDAHLPPLAERFTAERLQAVAQSRGLVRKERPEVLFVCNHNAGRSQMAAALLRLRVGDRVGVRSAGSAPASQVDARVREALAEIGAAADEQFPKPLTDEVVRAADVVVTMGCGDACPVYPGKCYLDWNVSDPLGRPLDEVRAISGAIDARVARLAAELVPVDPS